MSNIIIGTAGHVDHGKTSLIRSLTSRDTDRLEEEKRRGITIDLGFTYFDLPDNTRCGIIDVPGHEKFIKNMVVGVCGMDIVLLVIAADEGIMPQTKEHIDILSLVGVNQGIVVITKCDKVAPKRLSIIMNEIKEGLKDTVFSDAPICSVSSLTGKGIPELTNTIIEIVNNHSSSDNNKLFPRLPIDRVFTLPGLGTIITGTQISGTIKVGQKLTIYPQKIECKVRSLEVHNQSVKESFSKQRVAINLTGVKKEEVNRGDVISVEDALTVSNLVDVRLKLLKSTSRVLKNRQRLHFFCGTKQCLCRAILLDKNELNPGEECLAQLRMEEDVSLLKGDKFVVRFYSPLETIGGGEVIENKASLHKRNDETVIKNLRDKEKGNPKDVILLYINNFEFLNASVSDIFKLCSLPIDEFNKNLDSLIKEEKVLVFKTDSKTIVISKNSFDNKVSELENSLRKFHKTHQYRIGMNKEELRKTFFNNANKDIFNIFLNIVFEKNIIDIIDEFVLIKAYKPTIDSNAKLIKDKLLAELSENKLNFKKIDEIKLGLNSQEELNDNIKDIINLLVYQKEIVKINDEMYTLPDIIDYAKDEIIKRLNSNGGEITIAEVRDMFNITRKSAKPILEYMDSIKVTRKTGGESMRIAY